MSIFRMDSWRTVHLLDFWEMQEEIDMVLVSIVFYYPGIKRAYAKKLHLHPVLCSSYVYLMK